MSTTVAMSCPELTREPAATSMRSTMPSKGAVMVARSWSSRARSSRTCAPGTPESATAFRCRSAS